MKVWKNLGLLSAATLVLMTGLRSFAGEDDGAVSSNGPRDAFTPPAGQRGRRDPRPQFKTMHSARRQRAATTGAMRNRPPEPPPARGAVEDDAETPGRHQTASPRDTVFASGYIGSARPIPSPRGNTAASHRTGPPVYSHAGSGSQPDAIDAWMNEAVSPAPQPTYRYSEAPPPRHQAAPVAPLPVQPVQLADGRQPNVIGQARPIHPAPQPLPRTNVTYSRPPPMPVATPAARPGVGRTETYYPSGDRRTSALSLERTLPTDVRVGQAYDYEIKLTNLTGTELGDLVLEEQVPGAFKVNATTPQSESTGGTQLRWTLGTLAPRASKVLRVNGAATSTGELRYCATVTFKTQTCGTNRIVQPQLALTKTAPAEVILCDPISLRFVVTNTGTGIAKNVRISDTLPTGWTTADGGNAIILHAGNLAAGQSREFSVTAKAAAAGSFASKATATEDGGLTAEASAGTRVVQPVLVLDKTGPKTRYIGRPATYEITLSNTGDGPARETVLIDQVPASVKLDQVSDNGRFAGGTVTWQLGTIEPGATRAVTLTATPTQITTLTNNATARAYCAEAAASWTLTAKGIPAILVEVVDLDDPIEVGSSTTYQITIVNQGSAEGTNITVACTLPPEEAYVSATGPTPSSVQGKSVTFSPLASLPAKARVTYRVVVKANELATADMVDVRFRVAVTSDQAQVPIEETESTHIY